MQVLNTQKLQASKTIVFLMGATATGKTDLAIALAQQLPVAIISVDSALIYQGMDIGTAKPSKAIRNQYPHQLIDICQPEQTYSCAQFSQDAKYAIEQALVQGKIPLLVGGTGFYFRSLEYGLSPLPESNPVLKKQLEERLERYGVGCLYWCLKKIDPQSTQHLAKNDKQRIIRALEVFELSGKTLTELQNQPRQNALTYPIKKFILMPDRAVLHRRIEQRFTQMLAHGLLGEVKHLYTRGTLTKDTPAMRCVGYRQIWQYFENRLSYEQMVDKAIIATKQLCKRQNTWLRSEKNATILAESDIQELKKQIKN